MPRKSHPPLEDPTDRGQPHVFLILSARWIGDRDAADIVVNSMLAPSDLVIREMAHWMKERDDLFENVELTRISEQPQEI